MSAQTTRRQQTAGPPSTEDLPHCEMLKQLACQHFVGLGLRAESGNFEDFAILPRVDVDSIITIREGLLKKRREEDTKQG